MPFDNFFAYSLAGGTATSPTQPTDPGTDPTTAAVPTNGLVAYWNMDEESGDRIDSVGNNTLFDATNVASRPGLLALEAHFVESSQQYLTTNNNVATSAGSFTVGGWVNFEYVPPIVNFPIFAEYVENSQGFQILLQQDGNFRFRTSTDGGATNSVLLSTSTPCQAQTNYLVVGSYNSDTGEMILNINRGEEIVSVFQNPGGLNTSSEPFTVGGKITDATFHSGGIDEVFLYDRVLTEAEIAQIYNNGNGSTYVV